MELLVDYRNSTLFDSKKLPPKRIAKDTVKRIVLHCTDANGWTPERLSRFFVEERLWPCCGYHYYVTKEHIYWMVGENIVTYHAAPWNSSSVAVVIDYNATMGEKLNIFPDPFTLINAINTVGFLCLKFHVPPDMVVGHRELKYTGWSMKNDKKELRKTCPGMLIDLDVFRYNVTKKIQSLLNSTLDAQTEPLAVDGIFGAKTEKYFYSYTYPNA